MQAKLNSLLKTQVLGTALKHLVIDTALMAGALVACGSILHVFGAPIPNANPLAAVRDGNNAMLRATLQQGNDANQTDEEGTPLLMNAVLFADAEAVRMILDAGADPNATNAAGATALLWAAGDVQKAALLIAHGADVNAKSALGRTPLLAAAGQDARVVQALLARGADIHVADTMKGKPVVWMGGGGAQPVLEAARARDGRALRMLVAAGADVNAPDANGGTALSEAVALENVNNVRFLIEQGADVNVNVTVDRYTPLMLAAMRSNVALVQMLLQAGADVNAIDARGASVLMWAAYGAETGDAQIAELLIDAGADPTVRNRHGESAVEWAKRHGATPMVAFLKQSAQTE